MRNLLAQIEYPADLRRLPVAQLPQVCAELRAFIIDQVARYGGHFGASLGTVELTVALHYVLGTPYDQLIWDVGHQAYGHKILTGRREAFASNRRLGGLAGFPTRAESDYDAFGTGHSSTSISAALGLAQAAWLRGDHQRQHVAVIGDGSLTAGLAFEALNNAGDAQFAHLNLLVVVNDNGIAIDPNVGGLPQHLAALAQPPDQPVPTWPAGHPANVFTQLGLAYTGVADGHDVAQLVAHLRELVRRPGPRVLHVRTRKGKGYPPAEEEQVRWHSPGKFDKITGEIYRQPPPTQPVPPKYQDVFGQTLLELAQQNPDLVGITPAMLSGSGMHWLKEALPHRAYDVGIAEPHALTFAAGLAADGWLPVCHLYSTFMQRAYDQLIHDVCLQNLRLILCLDRAGLVGADGATHHGLYDLAYTRAIPHTIVAAPMDEVELRHLLYTAQLPTAPPGSAVGLTEHVFCLRYPRGKGHHPQWRQPLQGLPIGRGRCLQRGEQVALLNLGFLGHAGLAACRQLAAEGLEVGFYDLRFAKPLDTGLLQQAFAHHEAIVTLEDSALAGGFGSAVLEWAAERGLAHQVRRRLGLPDTFIGHGEPDELYAAQGLSVAGIAQALRQVAGQGG